MKRHHLHFLDEHGVWVGEDDAINATQRGPRVEEVDPKVSVVTLLTLANVLYGEGMAKGQSIVVHVELLYLHVHPYT